MPLTPPLPWKVTGAELRLVGTVLMVSVHSLTIRIPLTAERAGAWWKEIGQQPGQTAVKLPVEKSGAELCKIGWVARGVRVWCGSVEQVHTITFAWFDFLGREELAARDRHREGTHVA